MAVKNGLKLLFLSAIVVFLHGCKGASSLTANGLKNQGPSEEAASAAQLVLSGPSSVTAGACSGPVVVRVVDASLNSVATASNLPFSITGGAGFSIFSNAGCSNSFAAPLISASNSSTSFYFIAANAGNFTIAVDDSGPLTDGLLSVQAAATSGTTPVKFALQGPVSLNAQQCSSAYLVKTTNGPGVESAVNATTVVNITGKGSGDFYADAACSSMISSLTFAAGDSSKPFYYKGLSVANLTFNVDDAGPLTPASTAVAIVADPPTKLVVSGPTPITLGECRAYTVTSKDANNFVSSVNNTNSVNLTGAGAGVFYADSSCVSNISSVVINSGQSSAVFYLKTLSAGAITVSADNFGGLTAGTQAVTVNPLPYSKVVMSRPTVVAGTCTAVTATLKDSLNNSSLATSAVGVSLTSNGSAAFYSASNCLGTAITSATIGISQSSTTVYLKDTVAESIALGINSTGLTSDSWNATVAAGSNNKLQLIGPATNAVGSCAAYDLRLEDALGNLSPSVSSRSINFSGLSNARFYSDVNCATLASSATISASSSQTQIFLKGNVAESLTIGASSGTLVAASASVSFIAGSSNKLALSGNSPGSAGECIALNAAVLDSFDNPVFQASPLAVTMSGNGSGSFYSDAACTAATSTLTVATSSSAQTVWFKSNAPASLNLSASGAGVFVGEKSLTINPLPPTKLVMTGTADTSVGVCTPYSVSLQDTLNNLSSVGASKTLNFSGALSGAFYSDSNCSLPAASLTLSSTQTTAQIYYKGSAAQTANLSVDDGGLPDLASSTLAVVVASSGGGATLALQISGSTSINKDTCVPYAIMTTDAAGLSTNVTSNLTVTMAGAGTGTFYSDATCATSQSTVVISTGTSLSYIYYKNASAQNLIFAATATGASTSTLPVTVVNSAGSPVASRLTMDGNASILTNVCIPYVISLADANGNSMNAVANTTVTLAGQGSGTFYTNDACTVSAAGLVTINTGSSYTTAYYKNASAQNLILIAQSTGLSNGTLALAVSTTSGGATAGPAVKLSFVAQPSAIASTNENLGEQPIVAIYDSNNNVADAATSTITLAAYTDSACTLSAGPVLQATANPLNATGGVANFAGVNFTSAQSVYLKASSPGLASICSEAVQVYPLVAAKLAFTLQPSTTAVAGVGLTVQPQVSVLNYTNQVVTNAINSVSMTAYTDSTCTTAATGIFNLGVNNVIPSNGVVTFSGINYSVASTIYLKATSSGLTSSCSSGITVGPAPAYQLGIYYQPEAAGKAGDSFSLTARLYDSFGNTSLSTHSLTLTAYKSTNCTGSTSAITGGSASTTLGTATFPSIVFSEASTMSLKVSDATNPTVLETCSSPIAVDGGAPSQLIFSTQPSASSQIYVSLATPPAVMVQDAFSNQVKSATNQVTLSAYTDSGCSTTPASGTVTATNLIVGPTNGIATFASVTYSAPQVIYLKASAAGLTSACSSAITLINLSTKIATRGYFSCAIMGGNVKCWGYNAQGQLGDGSTANNPYPTAVLNTTGTGSLSNLTDVAVGIYHACALSSAGLVYCWGQNAYGQLGDNTTTSRNFPVQVSGLTNIISISAGDLHTCARSNTGAAYCWGYNGYGQLGDTSTTNRSLPVQVSGLTNVVSISASYHHTCANNSSGALYCWGNNGNGQLGDNSTTNRSTPVQVKGVAASGTLDNIVYLSAGSTHSCAVNAAGTTYCWGNNGNGQLGDGTGTQRLTPVQVSGISNVIAISAGSSNYTCAVTASRAVYCWGYNGYGQLGDNSTTQRNAPVQVLGVGGVGTTLGSIISISAGTDNTCAISDDGYTFCWGYNAFWQLGDQTATQRNIPVKVKENNSLFTSVSSQGDLHSCGIANEKVYCWGENGQGQLGDGTNTNRNMPTLISSLSGVKQVETGYRSTCAVLNSGAVYCWGLNNYGQLGDGTSTNRNSPVQVSGITTAIAVTTSGRHSCAVLANSQAYCWGYNNSGQLGNGTLTQSLTPVLVSGGLSFTAISAAMGYNWTGNSHTCAITSGGAAYCWGNNGYYQLGTGNTTNQTSPVQVSGFSSGVTAINTQQEVSCAIRNGVGYCWGTMYDPGWSTSTLGSTPSNYFGSGTTSISAGLTNQCALVNGAIQCYSPVGYYYSSTNGSTLKDIKTMSVSNYYSTQKMCALKNNGQLYCWGYDGGYSTYNFGTSNTIGTPGIIAIPPSTANQLTGVAVGETHTCGILNGLIQCWGTSAQGALGSGVVTSLTPSAVLINQTSSYLVGQTYIGTGGTHSCSLSNAGEVYCWGDNSYGKLGNNSTVATNKAIKVLGEGGIGTMMSATSLAVGYRHNCAVIAGYTYCWGYNSTGQLGIDSTMTMGTATKVVGEAGSGYLSGVSAVVAGRAHSCALVSGNVYCWGSNQYGQLGANSAVAQSNTPKKVVSVSGVGTLNNVTALAAGAYHTCALASGITYCWGLNSNRQLGNDSNIDSSYPVGVMNSEYITLTGVTSISSGAKHSCARTSVGEVYCWGNGSYGQLGLNSTVDVGAATKALGVGGSGVLSASVLATGSSANHSCAINAAQTDIYCWGLGTSGQIGNGTSTSPQLYPTPFSYSSILYLMVR